MSKREIQQKYFDKMAQLLKSVNGRKNKATIMYYLINELHLFRDGNGRTSRCVYELLANKDFNLDNSDYFSHNEEDVAKISGPKFEKAKNILRTEYAGNYASYFLLRYLIDLGLIDVNGDLMTIAQVRTMNDADAQGYSGVYISESAKQNISVKEVELVNRALLDNNEIYSVGGLTMLVMLSKKKNIEKLEEFNHSGKALPTFDGYTRSVLWIDNEENMDISAKSMGNWTREDYLVAIEIADELKESILDILIDIFERPESFKFNEELTIASRMTNYGENPFIPGKAIKDCIELHKAKFEIDKKSRIYEHIEKVIKILGKGISMSMPQSVKELGRQTLKQQEDTKTKDEEVKQINLTNQEITLDTNSKEEQT